MTWKSLGETDVRITPDYQFRIEEFRDDEDHQMVFVHLTVTRWAPDVLRDMIRHWKLFRSCVRCHLYGSAGEGDTEKWEKFVSLMGFKPLMKIICENGQERRLFVHTIKNKNERTVLTEHSLQSKAERHEHHEPVADTNSVSATGVLGRV